MNILKTFWNVLESGVKKARVNSGKLGLFDWYKSLKERVLKRQRQKGVFQSETAKKFETHEAILHD